MADREISYALRIICAEPGILSSYDRARLLRSLAAQEVLAGLPQSVLQTLREETNKAQLAARKAAKFSIGDDIVEIEGFHRKGQLIHIALRHMTQSIFLNDPFEVVLDGKKYIKIFYIACVGSEWDEHRVGTTNHSWTRFNYPRDERYLPKEVRDSPAKHILEATESCFQYYWCKVSEWD